MRKSEEYAFPWPEINSPLGMFFYVFLIYATINFLAWYFKTDPVTAQKDRERALIKKKGKHMREMNKQ